MEYPQWAAEQARAMEFEADAAEHLWVLYVACKRAEQLLVLGASVKDGLPIAGKGPGLQALAKAYDLTTGLPKVEGEPAKVTVIPPPKLE